MRKPISHPQRTVSPHSNLALLHNMGLSSEQDTSTADARPLISSSVLAWNAIEKLLQDERCIIDGHSLNIASVVAVAKSVSYCLSSTDHVRLTVNSRYGILTQISTDTEVDKRMDDSVSMLRTHLVSGHLVYGEPCTCPYICPADSDQRRQASPLDSAEVQIQGPTIWKISKEHLFSTKTPEYLRATISAALRVHQLQIILFTHEISIRTSAQMQCPRAG